MVGTKRIKVAFIQNILAPYRVRLFETISDDPRLDFELILHARAEPHRDASWMLQGESNYKFKYHLVKSIRLKKNRYDPVLYISYSYPFYLLSKRPDVIVCAGFSAATIVSYFYCRLFGKRYVVYNEGTEVTERTVRGLQLAVRRYLARRASCFVSVGELSKHYLTDVLGGTAPSFLSYNCSSVALPKGALDSVEKRAPDDCNLLFVGSLVISKGVWELIGAFEKLKAKCEGASLRILGSGKEEQTLRQYVLERGIRGISFLGFLEFDRAVEHWETSDVFILLSRSDRNPLVITEALSMGLPIVCSKCVGSHPDFVHQGKNGFVIDPENPDEVVTAVLDCLAANRNGSMSRYSLELSRKLTYENAAAGFIDAVLYSQDH